MKLAARIATRFGFSGKSRNHSGRAAAPAGLRWAKGSGAPAAGRRTSSLAALSLTFLFLAIAVSPAAADTPTATTGPISEVSYASAHVTGEVGPTAPGGDIYYFFQYSTDGIGWSNGPQAFTRTIPAESPATEVSEDLTNLKGGTEYFVRLTVNDQVVETYSPEPHPSFTTLAVETPKVLSVDDASEVTYTSAKVSGEIERPGNPDPAFDTSCAFQFITDSAFSETRDAQQQLTVAATAGTYKLGFDGQETGALAFDASAADVEAALNGLSTIGGAGGSVAISGGPGDEAGSSPYTVVFGGSLGNQANVSQISVDTASLTGSASVQTIDPGREEGFQGAPEVGCQPETENEFPLKTTGPKSVTANLAELAPGTTYHLRLTASNAGGTEALAATNTFTTLAVGPASASIAPVASITATSALFSGEINPQAPAGNPAVADVNWHYTCVPDCPGLVGGFIAADNSPHQVPEAVSGLEPNTDYQVTLTATNAEVGTTVGPVSFKTEAPPATVHTLGTGDIQTDSGVISASINPRNAPTTYQFEWGLGTGYGNFAPATMEPLGVIDNQPHIVSAELTGLQPGSSYHYRIVAINTQTGAKSVGGDHVLETGPASPPPPCPNESSRVGFAASLPSCRAYELASPGSNSVTGEVGSDREARATADGNTLGYITADAPLDAEGSTVQQWTVAQRGPNGWSVHSLAPPSKSPYEGFRPLEDEGLASSDFSEWLVESTQPLSGDRPSEQMNLYLAKRDGTFVPLTLQGWGLEPQGTIQWSHEGQGYGRASGDFTHIYFQAIEPQRPGEPQIRRNTYEWFDGQLNILGWLPSVNGEPEQPAPEGAALWEGLLPAISFDGSQVMFGIGNLQGIFLRSNGEKSTKLDASQKTHDPDLSPPSFSCNPSTPATVTYSCPVGVIKDGSKALFLSRLELTDDANTGEAEGQPTDQGADLYSYDTDSGVLTDLTASHDPANPIGADVKYVAAATGDGSYIYFVAGGALAQGASAGEASLYVMHGGEITYIAPAGQLGKSYVTPSGLNIAFASADRLTQYDNAGFVEVYKYTYGGGLVCVSCRPNGEPPTANAIWRGNWRGRAVSDDGARVFFESEDAVVPAATNGLANPYEFTRGEPHLLAPGDATARSYIYDASASGDDVFLGSHEELMPGLGNTFAIYDARVGAVTPPTPSICQGESCRAQGSTPPSGAALGSANFKGGTGVGGPHSLAVKGTRANLRLTIPEAGVLSISGKGLKSLRKSVSGRGSVTITVSLKSGARNMRQKSGAYRTKAKVVFRSSSGLTSSTRVALVFRANKKGGR